MDMMVEDLTQPTPAPPVDPTELVGYYVVCDDNFDPEAETLFMLRFATIADAIRCTQAIVDEFLAAEYKPGMTSAALYDRYTSFGAGPYFKADEGMRRVPFIVWDYAKQRCTEMSNGGSI